MNTNTTLKIFLLIILLQSSIFGATYYVSKNGNDNNVGSKEYPWKTLKKGFDSLKASDTLLIRGGTYYPTTILYPGAKNGASNESERITVKNYPNETVLIDGTNVVFSKPDTVYVEGVIGIANYRNFVTIDGLKIRNSRAMGIAVWYYTNNAIIKNCHVEHTQSSGIIIFGGSNHIIDNNEVVDFTYLGNHEGITAFATESITISNNYVHDIGNENSHNNGIGIDIKNGGSNHKVYGNKIHNVKLVGIYVDIRGGGSNIEIYNNYIYNVSGNNWPTANGIVLSDEKPEAGNVIDNVKIYNNILTEHYSKGISLGWSGIPGNPLQNIQVVNNVCYGNNIGIACDTTIGAYEQANNIVIANNILTNNTAQISKFAGVNEAAYTIDNNIIIGPSTLTGINVITADPLFVDAANNDFRINNGSPAFKTGAKNYFVSNIDFDENIRNNEDGPTIGAFEYFVPDNANSHVFIMSKDKLILTPIQ